MANIRLYERLGYTEERHETLKPGVDLVHITKAASSTPRHRPESAIQIG
jgi:hypothetical protein